MHWWAVVSLYRHFAIIIEYAVIPTLIRIRLLALYVFENCRQCFAYAGKSSQEGSERVQRSVRTLRKPYPKTQSFAYLKLDPVWFPSVLL
jgi:hypothetical protein